MTGKNKNSTMYGYARVSTKVQNLSRQLDALSAFGVPEKNVFVDKDSGKDFDRPLLFSTSPS